MKLDEKEIKVFSYVHMRADASISEIASAIGLKSHTVRYILDDLKGKDIFQPYVMINRRALRYKTFMVYFNIKPSFVDKKKEIIESLISNACCVWLGPAIGGFQYGMTLTLSSVNHIHGFFNELTDRHGSFWGNRTFSLDQSWFYFGKKYLLNSEYFPAPLHIGTLEEEVKIDKIDAEILNILIKDPLGSDSYIAKKLNQPATTVHNRIKNLKAKNIIGAYIYGTNYSKAQISAYRILIDFGGLGKELTDLFLNYAINHPNIVQLNIVTGNYDIEMSVEFKDTQSISTFINELSENFKDHLPIIKVLSRMDDLKWSMAGITAP